jgi:hypothetical protein
MTILHLSAGQKTFHPYLIPYLYYTELLQAFGELSYTDFF